MAHPKRYLSHTLRTSACDWKRSEQARIGFNVARNRSILTWCSFNAAPRCVSCFVTTRTSDPVSVSRRSALERFAVARRTADDRKGSRRTRYGLAEYATAHAGSLVGGTGGRLAAQARAQLPGTPEAVQRAKMTLRGEAVVATRQEAENSLVRLVSPWGAGWLWLGLCGLSVCFLRRSSSRSSFTDR